MGPSRGVHFTLDTLRISQWGDAYTVVYVYYYGRVTKNWPHGEISIRYAKRMCRYVPGHSVYYCSMP